MNNSVDAAARRLLETVNGVEIKYVRTNNDGGLIGTTAKKVTANKGIIYSELDSTEYKYGVSSKASFSEGGVAEGGQKNSGGMINPTELGVQFQS